MGGIGSTRWLCHTKKQTVEESLTLDGYKLLPEIMKGLKQHKGNPLIQWRGTIQWGRAGVCTASVTYTVYRDAVGYVMRLDSISNGFPTIEVIRLDSTPQPIGKSVRYWFLCPRCGTRRAKLHNPPGARTFACRTCYELTYESSQEAHRFDLLFADLGGSETRNQLQKRG